MLKNCFLVSPPKCLCAERLCIDCGKGWLRFENTCYFLSQNRFSWQQSREECQRMGGDLAVITNERMYLSRKGSLHYWIGLSHLGTNEWTWINNTALTVRWENNDGRHLQKKTKKKLQIQASIVK
uniref:C-type lectin domain-containing protein n=1 Tax=Sinocyclocheilus anshuiensis TaxID=1608454 RepID=A0A671Q1U8_9TELE